MAYINNLGQVRIGVRGWVAAQSGASVTDSDATAFVTAAGITDSTQISALNTLVADLKTYGLWTKMKAIYPFVGGSASSHKFNLKDPRDLDAAFRLVFNGGLTHDSSGITLNGTTGYVDTRMNANSTNFNYSSQHLSLYSRKNTDGSYVDMGVQTGGGKRFIEFCIRLNGNFYGALFYNDTNGGADYLTYTNNDSRGFYTFNRPSNTIVSIFNNSTKVSTRTQTSSNTMFSEKSLFIGGMNGFPVAGGYTNRQYAFSSIGDGLTDTEAANFYISVQKFQTTLGRHVGTPYVSDPDAIAFLMAAGITDGTQAAAINTLVIRMKADGVWTKMKAIYPFVGGTAASHKFNLKDPRDLDAAFRLVFNGGWTHTGTGAKPNGTTGYANTYLNPYVVFGGGNPLLPSNSTHQLVHISKYSRTNSTITDNFDGVYTGAYPQSCWLGIGWNSGWAPNGAGIINTRSTNPSSVSLGNRNDGFFVVNRDGYTSLKSFRNSVLVSTDSTESRAYNEIGLQTNLNPQNVFLIGALNTAYDFTFRPLSYNNYETSFQSIGWSLTDTEASNFYSAVQAFQTTLGRQTDVPLVSDTDAQAFLNAANITSFQQASAVNKLVVDLKAAGVWSKMKAIYPFVGGSAATHKWNLKDPRDLDAAFRLVFNGGGTHSSTGYLGNGTNSYGRTFILHNSLQQNSVHLSYYNRYNSSATYNNFMGCVNTINAPDKSLYIAPALGINPFSGVNSKETYTTPFYTSVNKYWLVNRSSSTQEKTFINGVLGSTINKSSTTLTSNEIYVGAINVYGNAGINEAAFASIGDGLTDAESTALYTAVQTYQTSLGRGVNTAIYNNGLVLNLDAGNANSYPGTGTTWFDLAAGNNGTLVNGPTYDTANGGSIVFDGVNDYVGLGNIPIFGTSSFTIDMWIYLPSTDSNYRAILSKRSNSNYTGFAVYRPPYSNSVGIQLASISAGPYFTTSISSNANSWNHISIVVDRTLKTVVLYSNGIKNTTTLDITNLGDMTNNSVNLNLGLEAGISNWNNKISTTKIYSRALTETEVLSNFNSTRGRFGL